MGETPGEQAPSVSSKEGWQQIINLLVAGRYRAAAILLREKEEERSGDSVLCTVLEAACQLCLTCREYGLEKDKHRQAQVAAVAREEELRQKILTLVALLAKLEIASPAIPDKLPPASEITSVDMTKSPGVWQRVRNLLSGLATPFPKEIEDKPESANILEGELESEDVWEGEPEPADAREDASEPPTEEDEILTSAELTPQVGPSEVQATRAPTNRQVADQPSLVVYCLGPFAVYQNDRLITDWNGLKGLMILKYMIAHRKKPVAKEVLMEIGWPESNPEAARRNLHQAIYSLRQTLRQDEPDFQHIQFHRESYRFHPELNVWIDYIEFEKYVTVGQRLAAEGKEKQALSAYGIAAELYQGDFFEEDLYAEWTIGQRERLHNLYLQVADELIEHNIRQEAYTTATAVCQKVLAQDPCYEAAHRHLMNCYIAQGQRHLAVRQYQVCTRLLTEELDLEPSEATQALYEHIIARASPVP